MVLIFNTATNSPSGSTALTSEMFQSVTFSNGNASLSWSNTSGGGTAPAVTTASLPNGTVGTTYSQTLMATGSTPITWSIDTGSLPNGLTLSTAGVISGTLTTANTFNFTVKATNATGNGTKALSIVIATSGGGGGNGTFTLSGIPSTHNGKYAFLYANTSTGNLAYGCQSGNTMTGVFTLSPISGGSCNLPMWLVSNTDGSLSRYSGNDTFSVNVTLSPIGTVDLNDSGGGIGTITFTAPIAFSNGSATRAWSAGQYYAE